MQSYIRTYCMLRKRERGGGGRAKVGHRRLAEVVPNCSVAFYDMRDESSLFYYPIPAGWCPWT